MIFLPNREFALMTIPSSDRSVNRIEQPREAVGFEQAEKRETE
jgi:hypothetical protein